MDCSNEDSACETDLEMSDALPAIHTEYFDEEKDTDALMTPYRSTGHQEVSLLNRKRKNFYDSSSDNEDTYSMRPKQCKRAQEQYLQAITSLYEALPMEILQEIAVYLETDLDLSNITQTCKTMATAIHPENSSIWKARFLSLYDHPSINGPYDFCVAYKLRRFVLRNFVSCCTNKHDKIKVQLEVLQDMVLETYHRPKYSTVHQGKSRNLAQFSSPGSSPWMLSFLNSPFYGEPRYGEENCLFESLQLMFSHLILSPKSQMSQFIGSSRDNFDLAKVYNWNQPFATLYSHQNPEKRNKVARVDEKSDEDSSFSLGPFDDQHGQEYHSYISCDLDLHSLLHIRNFWHRHLIDSNHRSMNIATIGENTYAAMARGLSRLGFCPKEWETSLHNHADSGKLNERWYGHYSCLHPWPKKREDLEERQSCAEDWTEVNPLTLDFSTSTDNVVDIFWPPIFSTIPAFAKTTPDTSCTYFRGIAPFLDLKAGSRNSRSSQTFPSSSSTSSLQKYHPYTSLRLRGLIHPVAPQSGIPGWNRVIMILFKPNSRYLISVLEHAEEEYGNPVTTHISAQLSQVPNPVQQAPPPPHPNQQAPVPIPIDPVAAERYFQSYLITKLTTNPAYAPENLDCAKIAEVEDAFSTSEYLDWNDIEYAYAYEGVVIPGGKIMFGRWWRCGLFGSGDGKECGVDGGPVDEEGDGDGEGQGGRRVDNNWKAKERGPFVFWS